MLGKSLCRACFSSDLYCYLPLGDHPAANAFVRPERLDQSDQAWPLDTHVCIDCGLIQVPDPLPADFYVDYVYVPSASTTMPIHFKELAGKFRREARNDGDLVVDIGSNDGLLLAACKAEGLRVLGVDPSANIGALAAEKDVEVYEAYFTLESAQAIKEQYGQARIIVTTNTINHVDDLHAFMQGVDVLLAPEGSFVIEVPQALTCIEFNEFDTVYHEHLSTFSATSVAAMGAKVGLRLVDIDELPIHGGSMRLTLRRSGDPSPALTAYLEREKAAGLFERATYDAHVERVEAMRQKLLALFAELKSQGKTIRGYSSPAKGNTLLNYFRIGPDTLPWIADMNTLKQGRYTPGMRIPVVAPSRVLEEQPDYLFILAWNFRDEIVRQHQEYLARGGKLIFPIPAVEVVDHAAVGFGS